MENLKTVERSVRVSDPLLTTQNEDVAKMRASLLALSSDPTTVTQSLQNITVLRVCHQVARIIRYLDLMDKLEAKLYDSIEHAVDNMNPEDTSTWMLLLNIQERLQKNMLESHKLLQPYLSIDEFNLVELASTTQDVASLSGEALLIEKSSRDKIRNSAQAVLSLLDGSGAA